MVTLLPLEQRETVLQCCVDLHYKEDVCMVRSAHGVERAAASSSDCNSPSEAATKWVLVRGEVSKAAFRMCRSILQWLLEMDEEPEATAWL